MSTFKKKKKTYTNKKILLIDYIICSEVKQTDINTKIYTIGLNTICQTE